MLTCGVFEKKANVHRRFFLSQQDMDSRWIFYFADTSHSTFWIAKLVFLICQRVFYQTSGSTEYCTESKFWTSYGMYLELQVMNLRSSSVTRTFQTQSQGIWENSWRIETYLTHHGLCVFNRWKTYSFRIDCDSSCACTSVNVFKEHASCVM